MEDHQLFSSLELLASFSLDFCFSEFSSDCFLGGFIFMRMSFGTANFIPFKPVEDGFRRIDIFVPHILYFIFTGFHLLLELIC